MDTGIFIRVMYGVMFAGMIMIYILGSRQQRSIRQAVDAFAAAFARIGNLAAPRPVADNLSADALQSVARQATGPDAVAAYHQLSDGLDKVLTACGRGKRYRRQFAVPVQDIFDKTRSFLICCEHFDKGKADIHKKEMNAFLRDQGWFRRELFKRISRSAGEEYLGMNEGYELR